MAGSVFQDPGLSIPMLNMDDQTDVGMEKEGRGPTMSTGFMGDAESVRRKETAACSRSSIAGVITTAALKIVVVSGGVHLRLIIPGTSCGDIAEEEANLLQSEFLEL